MGPSRALSLAFLLYGDCMDLKKPYTLDEQIKKLKDHGVVISDEAFAKDSFQLRIEGLSQVFEIKEVA